MSRRSGKRSVIIKPTATRSAPEPVGPPVDDPDGSREKMYKKYRLIDRDEKEILARYENIISELQARKGEYSSRKQMQQVLYRERSIHTRLVYEKEQMRSTIESMQRRINELTKKLEGIKKFMSVN